MALDDEMKEWTATPPAQRERMLRGDAPQPVAGAPGVQRIGNSYGAATSTTVNQVASQAPKPPSPPTFNAAQGIAGSTGGVASAAPSAEEKASGPSPRMGAIAQGNAKRVERMGGEGIYSQANRDLSGVATYLNRGDPVRDAANAVGKLFSSSADAARTSDPTGFGHPQPDPSKAMDLITGRRRTMSTPSHPALMSFAENASPGRFLMSSAGATQGAGASASPALAIMTGQPALGDLTQQQRNDAGDAYRTAWQREAPGGLRNASGAGLDLYNAEQQVRGTGITAQRDASGRMSFSGDGTNASPQDYTQGFDLNLANERMARANAIRGETARILQNRADGRPDDWSQANSSGGGIRDSSQADRERAALIRQMTTPKPGAQNRQLTIGQTNALQKLLADEQAGAQRAREAEQRLGVDQQRLGLDQQRLTQDAGLAGQRIGMDAQRLMLDQRRADTEAESQGLQNEQAQMLMGLRRRITTPSSDEDARNAMKTLQTLTGQGGEQPNRFTVVPGGQEVTDQGMRTVPSRVFNNQTGQFVEPMDRVRETARARGMTEQQVIEILRQNGHQVS